MKYIFSEEEKQKLMKLISDWENMTEQMDEFDFMYDKFISVAKATFPYIAKFAGSDYPAEIVKLLIRIHDFAVYVWCNSDEPESNTASLVAEALCDVENHCGITCISTDNVNENAKLKVCGPSDAHIIDPNTFDLSELLADITANWH